MLNDNNSNKNNNSDDALEVIRWIGFLAGLVIVVVVLLFPRYWLGTEVGKVLVAIGLFILPAFASSILSLTRHYWFLILPATWLIFAGSMFRSEGKAPIGSALFLMTAVLILAIPFLAWGLRTKGKSKTGQQTAPDVSSKTDRSG